MKPKYTLNLALTLAVLISAFPVSARASRPSGSTGSQTIGTPKVATEQNVPYPIASSDDARTEAPNPQHPIVTGPYLSELVPPADTRGLARAATVDPSIDVPWQRPYSLPLPGRDRTTNAPEEFDPVVQRAPGAPNMPLTLQNFEGLSNLDGVAPPDTDGQVGPNHYIQMVNLSTAIYDKQGNLLYGPFHPSDLWPSGDVCKTHNDGDVIVLYDQLADRWLLTQFAVTSGPYYQCIAVSKGPNPTDDPNDWFPYTFAVHPSKFNDYPKLGVWPDGYYMSANQFENPPLWAWAGAGAWVFDRDAMLRGAPASFQYFDVADLDINYGGLLPSNLMGDRMPPAGAPNYFMSVDQNWSGVNDILHVFEFHTDWDNPANSSFSLATDLTVAPFDWDICPAEREACVPQPGTGTKVEAIADRLMMHLWYRNLGDHESLVVNHTVDADNAPGGSSGRSGVRWYEIRGGTVDTTLADATLHQQGTYAPDDGVHRWMGSIAMDYVGNMALGYSVSDSTSTYPGIRYAGRLVTDTLSTLPQAEETIINGGGSQTTPNRWGDYSAMSVDPKDDCTFWYTQQYIETTGAWNWQTRIASFKLPGCVADSGTLEGTVTDGSTAAAVEGATVRATAPGLVKQTSTDDSGHFVMNPLSDTYTVTVTAYGYVPATVPGVVVSKGITTTRDIQLTALNTHIVSGTITDATTGWPLYARISIGGDPIDPPAPYNQVWSDPVSGWYSVTLAEGISYTFDVEAWVPGYTPISRDIDPLTADVTEDFALTADTNACAAPGRVFGGFSQSFETTSTPPGWTIVDNVGNGAVWRFDDPNGRGNLTGGTGNAAIVEGTAFVGFDTELRSPAVDLSDETIVTLTFKYDFNWFGFMGTEVADVDVSVNGAAGPWTNVWRRSGASDRGPKTASLDISTIAAGQSNVMVRFRYYDNVLGWWWQVDDVSLGQPSCVPSPGGLVVGNAYDGNIGDPFIGAVVENEDGYKDTTQATPADPSVDDGFYTLFSPASSRVFTATMSRYASDVAAVTVIQGDTVLQDFHLPAGWLSPEPVSYDINVSMGMSATVPFTLANLGGVAASFEFQEIEGQYGLTGPGVVVSVPPSKRLAGQVGSAAAVDAPWRYPLGGTYDDRVPSSLKVPADVLLVHADESANAPQTLLESYPDIGNVDAWDARGSIPGLDDLLPYDVVIAWSNYVYADRIAMGDVLADFVDAGGAVILTPFNWYDNNSFGLGGRFVDEAYSPFLNINGGNHFGAANLGTFDTSHPIMQGATAASDLFRDIVDLDPDAYLVASWDDGEAFIATKGRTVAFNSFVGDGYQWTGDVGILLHNAINYVLTVGDVPWLTEDPISGTIPSLVDGSIELTFDASVPEVDAPGVYQARLLLRNTTPYLLKSVPMTMTVSAPSTWGRLQGTVSALGHCDTNPTALEDADVRVEGSDGTAWTLMSDVDGYYTQWLDEAHSPFTVTVSYAEHDTAEVGGVLISSQVTTTLDFDLRWLKPCLILTPAALEDSLSLGESATHILTLNNAGAGTLDWEVVETIPWISVTPPVNGTLVTDANTDLDVTFDGTSLTPGLYSGTMVLNSNDPTAPVQSVPLTLTVTGPQPAWEKAIWIDGEGLLSPEDSPFTGLTSSNIITVQDRVWLTYTSAITFTLQETWSASLSITDIKADGGAFSEGPGRSMVWAVSSGAPNRWYVLTKTFEVTGGIWTVGGITETLTVSDTYPQLDPVRLAFLRNNAPLAAQDVYTTTEDTALSVVAPGVLNNDDDDDGDPIWAVINASPAEGIVRLSADGSFIYTPTAAFTGSDRFTYYASDGIESSNVTTVTLNIVPAAWHRLFLPITLKNP